MFIHKIPVHKTVLFISFLQELLKEIKSNYYVNYRLTGKSKWLSSWNDSKNFSPVTGADRIFHYRGWLFTQYWGSAEVLQKQFPRAGNFHPYRLLVIVSFSCISFLEIKIGTEGFNVCINDCTIFVIQSTRVILHQGVLDEIF